MGIRIEGEPLENEDAAALTHEPEAHELTDAELDAESNDSETEGEQESEALVTIGEPPADTSAATGDESQDQPAPEWAKQLRKDYRRLQRELADERRKAAPAQPSVESLAPTLKEPTLEACGWDEAEFRKQTAAYLKEQSDIERRKEQQAEAIRKQQEDEKAVRTTYRTAAAALKVRDFDEAEDTICATLSETQQNILLAGCDNAALVVYALGKNPAKADELAKITNPVKFAVALGKLEKEIKVTNRKPNKPAPETIPTRTASLSGGGNTALDAARKKAEQTGDYSEVNRIRRAQRAAQRGK